jgi:hypothetical protein
VYVICQRDEEGHWVKLADHNVYGNLHNAWSEADRLPPPKGWTKHSESDTFKLTMVMELVSVPRP